MNVWGLKQKKIHYALKCRVYPTEDQKVFLKKQFGCCRLVYNLTLDWMNFYHGVTKKSISIMNAKKLLSFLKGCSQYSFLKEMNSQSLQASVLNLGKGFDRFFDGKGGKPKFKKKGGRECFEVPQNFLLKKSKRNNDFLLVPKLRSSIKIKLYKDIVTDDVSRIHISIDPSGKYYASLNCERDLYCVNVVSSKYKDTGYDLGVSDFLIGSDGSKKEAPKLLRKSEGRLKQKSRELSSKKKGSKNAKKARMRLAKYHARIRNQRKNFHHKLSSKIVDENQVLYFETLSPKNMMKNRCLSKSFADAGWTAFLTKVKYKANWQCKEVIQIGRFEPSSKMCSSCGALNKDLKLHHRLWRCKACNSLHDRDINAAKNIKKIGQRMSKLTPVERITNAYLPKRGFVSWLVEAGSVS